MKIEIDEKSARWKGIAREEINWNPTIDESKSCCGGGKI